MKALDIVAKQPSPSNATRTNVVGAKPERARMPSTIADKPVIVWRPAVSAAVSRTSRSIGELDVAVAPSRIRNRMFALLLMRSEAPNAMTAIATSWIEETPRSASIPSTIPAAPERSTIDHPPETPAAASAAPLSTNKRLIWDSVALP